MNQIIYSGTWYSYSDSKPIKAKEYLVIYKYPHIENDTPKVKSLKWNNGWRELIGEEMVNIEFSDYGRKTILYWSEFPTIPKELYNINE